MGRVARLVLADHVEHAEPVGGGEPIAGNGITLRVRVGTAEIYALTLPKTASVSVPFDVTTPVVAGGTIDFVDDPIDGNAYYDATTFELRITKGE